MFINTPTPTPPPNQLPQKLGIVGIVLGGMAIGIIGVVTFIIIKKIRNNDGKIEENKEKNDKEHAEFNNEIQAINQKI